MHMPTSLQTKLRTDRRFCSNQVSISRMATKSRVQTNESRYRKEITSEPTMTIDPKIGRALRNHSCGQEPNVFQPTSVMIAVAGASETMYRGYPASPKRP